MRSRRIWFAALIACVILGLAVLIGTSPSFEKCEHERKNHQAYSPLHKESPPFVKAIVRLGLHAACARQTASENDGAIAGLSGIAVALFTLALWVSTDKLWQASRDGQTDLLRSIAATERTADAMLTASNAAQKSADMAVISANAAAQTANAAVESLKIERPFVFYEIISGSMNNHSVTANIRFVNHGRTPAVIVFGGARLAKTAGLDDEMVKWRLQRELRQNDKVSTVIPGNGGVSNIIKCNIPSVGFTSLSIEDEWKLIFKGEVGYLLVGGVIYTGPTKTDQFTTRFAFRVYPRGGDIRLEERCGKDCNFRT